MSCDAAAREDEHMRIALVTLGGTISSEPLDGEGPSSPGPDAGGGGVVPVSGAATFAREVLPFHEQFMRSHSWWSPDGTAFCFAALDDYGNDAVWVATVATGRRERISTGSLAVWSPI